ncbi:hypothetical protein WJX84_002455 [Apatococcus fuscideae]|uniref:Uncharacterized protein n=1 Tax=Apatococcus fuscideae TaxID=2026836 RepID=A0AAW1SW88_9CHLO
MLAACVSLTGRLPVRTVSNPARFLLASVPGSRPLQKNQSCLSRPASTQQRCRPLRALPLIQASSEEIAMMFFGTSIVPYSVFLYFLTKSKQAPGLLLFGFYFLLVFVFATIPAGIIAKRDYGTILANVDWLHGTAESMLTVTNLFIVFGLLRKLCRRPIIQSFNQGAARIDGVEASTARSDIEVRVKFSPDINFCLDIMTG